MKLTRPSIIAVGVAALYGLSACAEKDSHHDSDHDHDHDESGEHVHDDNVGGDAAHSDQAGHGEDHDHDEDHDHEGIVAGPNGGRVLTGVEPHAEFLVTGDRRVQIAFVDEENKTVPAAGQSVTVIAGDRTNPTRLTFAADGEVLVSDRALPEGNNFPLVIQIKATPESENVIEKFNLDLNVCPTCTNQEYACTCDHHHDE